MTKHDQYWLSIYNDPQYSGLVSALKQARYVTVLERQKKKLRGVWTDTQDILLPAFIKEAELNAAPSVGVYLEKRLMAGANSYIDASLQGAVGVPTGAIRDALKLISETQATTRIEGEIRSEEAQKRKQSWLPVILGLITLVSLKLVRDIL